MLFEKCDKVFKSIIKMLTSSLIHVTVCNKQHPGLSVLRLSAYKCGLQTRVLGLGSKTRIGHGKSGGFGLKLQMLKEWLPTLHPDQLVLFTDAYDVVLQGSFAPLEKWCLEHPDKVLFASERSNWPDPNAAYPLPLKTPTPYLNSGVFAGKAGNILELLSEPFDDFTDDQGYYSKRFLKDYGTPKQVIHLDYDSRFFACLQGCDGTELHFDSKQGMVRLDVNGETQTPFVLHLNNGLTRRKWYVKVATHVIPNSSRVKYLAWDVFVRQYLHQPIQYLPFYIFLLAWVLFFIALLSKLIFK